MAKHWLSYATSRAPDHCHWNWRIVPHSHTNWLLWFWLCQRPRHQRKKVCSWTLLLPEERCCFLVLQEAENHCRLDMCHRIYGCLGDTTSISLTCRLAHFTVSLRFSLTYTFPSFRCLGPLPCASADLPLRHFTVVPLSLALPLLTLVPRLLRIPLLYNVDTNRLSGLSV